MAFISLVGLKMKQISIWERPFLWKPIEEMKMLTCMSLHLTLLCYNTLLDLNNIPFKFLPIATKIKFSITQHTLFYGHRYDPKLHSPFTTNLIMKCTLM